MKALLVIDMQKGFMKDDSYWELSKSIDKLITSNNYDKIIFTKFVNSISLNSFYQEKLGWKGLVASEEQEFSLKVPDNSIILTKNGYGLDSEGLNIIKCLNIKEIDVCGVTAEACVYAVSFQLWDNGIYPNILTDYVLGEQYMFKMFAKQFGAKIC